MAGKSGNTIERAVNGAFADVEKHAAKEFKEILQADPQKKEMFKQEVKEAAEVKVKLAAEFSKQAGTKAEDIARRLKSHYSDKRLDLVKKALQVPTYQLQISKKQDGYHWVDITRSGKKFMDPVRLESTASISTTNSIQLASIVVEVVLLVLQAAGIELSVSSEVIFETAKQVVDVLDRNNDIQKALDSLIAAMKSDSVWDQAKAIFKVIIAVYSGGIFWEIVKSLCKNMSAWDWIKTIGIVSAVIIADIATDGVALIAEIVVALGTAYDFINKFANLNKLEAIGKTL